VVDHLRKLAGFDQVVFPWNYNPRTLYAQFARIQKEARIHLPCSQEHKHSDACHVCGFHDGQRAFATMNADRLGGDALQALVRHKSYTTSQKYIDMARQMKPAAQNLFVPELPGVAEGQG
jgi:hypothetical protein